MLPVTGNNLMIGSLLYVHLSPLYGTWYHEHNNLQKNVHETTEFPDYFETILMLHRSKMDCFLNLSGGTTESEKNAFAGYDLCTEVERMIDRFHDHPEEKEENLPAINSLIYADPEEIRGRFDIIIVLGSNNCGYRAEKALEAGRNDPETIYVVSGGNIHRNGKDTEAAYLAEYLKAHKIDDSKIIIEDKAVNTFQNLEFSARLIEKLPAFSEICRIGIVTAGFHMKRTKMLAERVSAFHARDVVFISAYGENTRPDNWYSNPYGRMSCLGEIAKCRT